MDGAELKEEEVVLQVVPSVLVDLVLRDQDGGADAQDCEQSYDYVAQDAALNSKAQIASVVDVRNAVVLDADVVLVVPLVVHSLVVLVVFVAVQAVRDEDPVGSIDADHEMADVMAQDEVLYSLTRQDLVLQVHWMIEVDLRALLDQVLLLPIRFDYSEQRDRWMTEDDLRFLDFLHLQGRHLQLQDVPETPIQATSQVQKVSFPVEATHSYQAAAVAAAAVESYYRHVVRGENPFQRLRHRCFRCYPY